MRASYFKSGHNCVILLSLLVSLVLTSSTGACADTTQPAGVTATTPAEESNPQVGTEQALTEESKAADSTPVVVPDSTSVPRIAGSSRGGGNTEVSGTEVAAASGSFLDRFAMVYYGSFFGPSLEEPSSYQPTPTGEQNLETPLVVKNYLSALYGLNDNWAVGATAYFHYQPVLGQKLLLRDPYIKVANTHVIQAGGFNLYSDARLHFPVSTPSRDQDMLSSVQNFNVATFQIPESRFTLGTYFSERMYFYGKRATRSSNDAEFYLAPNAAFQMTRTLAATVLYEMGASHGYGDKPFVFTNDGTDLQPGLSWDITPSLNINPYLNIYTGNKVSLRSTSIGMNLYWNFL